MFRGTVIAQLIAVIVGIYLAKLYGQEAYGFLGFFISITNIGSIATTLQLDNCIITSKNKNESKNWFNFLLFIIPFTTILLFCILLLFSQFFYIKKLNTTIFLLTFVGTIITTYNLVHLSYFTFKKKFDIISNSKVFIAVCNVLFQLILFHYYNLLGLILGFLISQTLLLIYNLFYNKNEIKLFNLNEIKSGIKTNIELVKYLLPSNILNSLANNLMPILILTFFGAEKAGVYFFSIKILATPLFLISSSISQVYFKESSDLNKKNNKELLSITKKIVGLNVSIMFIFLLLINTLGIYFLDFYFDGNWENLNIYILILSYLILARSSFNPISSLIVVLDKNLVGLVFNIYLFIINIIAIYVGSLANNILYTVFILSLFGGIGYFILLYYFFGQLKKAKTNV